MSIRRWALFALIAGAWANESLARAHDKSKRQAPVVPSVRNDGWRGRERARPVRDTDVILPVLEKKGLDQRQETSTPIPTVFTTQIVTSTITTFFGPAVTSIVFTTLTTTLTTLDGAKGEATETFTETLSAPQRRTVATATSSSELSTASQIRLRILDPTTRAPSEEESSMQIRQDQVSTITSTLTQVSRTVVTAAPTILVTSATTVLSTLTVTPPVSTTISLTVTISMGRDGSVSTMLPPTTTTSSTSLTTTPTAATAVSDTDSDESSKSSTPQLGSATLGGISAAAAFAGLVLLLGTLCICRRCRRRRRRNRDVESAANSPRGKPPLFRSRRKPSTSSAPHSADSRLNDKHVPSGVGSSLTASGVAQIVRETLLQQRNNEQLQTSRPTTRRSAAVIAPPPPPPPPPLYTQSLQSNLNTAPLQRTFGLDRRPKPRRPIATPISRPRSTGDESLSGGTAVDNISDDDVDSTLIDLNGLNENGSSEVQYLSPVASSEILALYSPAIMSSTRSSSLYSREVSRDSSTFGQMKPYYVGNERRQRGLATTWLSEEFAQIFGSKASNSEAACINYRVELRQEGALWETVPPRRMTGLRRGNAAQYAAFI